jgi:hypothetical protein
MGRLIEISPQQDVVNKINAKADFTHNINNTRLERYTVSIRNVLKTANPSLFSKNTWQMVDDAFNSQHELFGGWLSDDGIYFLDYGLSVSDLKAAMKIAKFNKQLAIYDNVSQKVIPVAD